jgi:hypothetical protein
VLVTAEEGVSQDELKRRVSAVIPPTTQAKTQKETADEAGKAIGQFLGFFNTILLAVRRSGPVRRDVHHPQHVLDDRGAAHPGARPACGQWERAARRSAGRCWSKR